MRIEMKREAEMDKRKGLTVRTILAVKYSARLSFTRISESLILSTKLFYAWLWLSSFF
jgi:hypothetical protein